MGPARRPVTRPEDRHVRLTRSRDADPLPQRPGTGTRIEADPGDAPTRKRGLCGPPMRPRARGAPASDFSVLLSTGRSGASRPRCLSGAPAIILPPSGLDGRRFLGAGAASPQLIGSVKRHALPCAALRQREPEQPPLPKGPIHGKFPRVVSSSPPARLALGARPRFVGGGTGRRAPPPTTGTGTGGNGGPAWRLVGGGRTAVRQTTVLRSAVDKIEPWSSFGRTNPSSMADKQARSLGRRPTPT